MPQFLRQVLVVLTGVLVSLGSMAPVSAQGGKPLLDTQIVFQGGGKGRVSYTSHVAPTQSVDLYKVESALIFYAYAMQQLGDQANKDLLNQMQRSISRVATEQGLQRADLLADNPIVSTAGKDSEAKGFDLKFEEIAGQGHGLNVLPKEGSEKWVAPAVIYYFQDLVNNLPESALRITVLAVGGMNKWYREEGKASDPGSLSKAPAYGLNLAVDIIGKLSGQKI
jgi:hypothetical protein